MRKTVGKSGFKPAIAFINQTQALENLNVKLKTLRASIIAIQTPAVAGDTSGLRVRASLLKMLPTSPRQFNAWNSDKLRECPLLEPVSFSSNAQFTLKASGLIEAVKEVLTFVRRLKETVPPDVVRHDTIESLRRRLSLANKLRGIAETEIIELKIQVLGLRADLRTASQKLHSANSMAAETIATLHRRVTDLDQRLKQRGDKGTVVKIARDTLR